MGSRKGGILNLSMKKFGTPTRAAPGSASEYVGSLRFGGCAWSSGTGVGVGTATLPVSDSVLAASEARLGAASTPSWDSPLALATFFLVFLGAEPLWEPLSGVADALGAGAGVAVAVGSTLTVGGATAVGDGVLSTEPRSTIDETGAGSPGI